MSGLETLAFGYLETYGNREELISFSCLCQYAMLMLLCYFHLKAIFLLLLGLGALIFGYFESWSPMEGAYFSFITLSTIGFGDFVPGSEVGAYGVSLICYLIMT